VQLTWGIVRNDNYQYIYYGLLENEMAGAADDATQCNALPIIPPSNFKGGSRGMSFACIMA
jgi:hypothetical protein